MSHHIYGNLTNIVFNTDISCLNLQAWYRYYIYSVCSFISHIADGGKNHHEGTAEHIYILWLCGRKYTNNLLIYKAFYVNSVKYRLFFRDLWEYFSVICGFVNPAAAHRGLSMHILSASCRWRLPWKTTVPESRRKCQNVSCLQCPWLSVFSLLYIVLFKFLLCSTLRS